MVPDRTPVEDPTPLRTLLLRVGGLVGGPGLLVVGLRALWTGRPFIGAIDLFLAAVALCVGAICVKRKDCEWAPYLFVAAYLVVSVAQLAAGDARSPGYLWCLPFPITAITLLGITHGSIAVALLVTTTVLLLLVRPLPSLAGYPPDLSAGIVATEAVIAGLALLGGQAHRLTLAANRSLQRTVRQLREAQAQLLQSEKLASIGRLSAGIAHEINNPVGFVSSNTVTLKDYVGRIIEVAQLYEKGVDPKLIAKRRKTLKYETVLGDIDNLLMENLEGLSRITAIVSDLKKFARNENSSEHAPADINDGIRGVILLSKNEWKYVADVCTDLSPVGFVECNSNELNQVILNCIVNAAQAIRGQKRKDKGTILIRTYREHEWVCCDIRDDGPGIPDDIRDKVLLPFFTTKESGEGTGLGLSISHDIVVNRHRGKFFFKSEKGSGTTFTIAVPNRPVPQAAMHH